MAEPNIALDNVRQEIDRIDRELHELIRRRTEIVIEVGKAKKGSNTHNFAPGREAQVIRKRISQHEGSFPAISISRIWRELISVNAALQGPFAVVAYADGDDQGCWDLARDQYGCHGEMSTQGSVRAVIAKVFSRDAAIGVVPLPDNSGAGDCWWRSLCVADAPQVVQRLPFVDGSNARHGKSGAYAISHVHLDESGDDRTLIVVETGEQMTQQALRILLEKAGLAADSVVSRQEEVWVHLVDVAGFVKPDGPELSRLKNDAAVARVCIIGGYAVPVGSTEKSK
jgi:chorismate mutase/prephenate dehydratase